MDANLVKSCEELDSLADWSEWMPIGESLALAPRSPGVYTARQGRDGPVVYVGMAGERNGKGIRGRLGVYLSGKALASGLGEAVFDRALAGTDWLHARLLEAEAGTALRATQWGKAAFERADLHVRWASTPDRAAALVLERTCLESLRHRELWNRLRPGAPTDDVLIRSAIDAVTPAQWAELSIALDAFGKAPRPAAGKQSAIPRTEVVDGAEREVHQFGFSEYAAEVTTIVDLLYKLGLIVPFDWQSWAGSQPVLAGKVPISDPETAVRYLTAVVRGERLCDGTLQTSIESGRLTEALHALRVRTLGRPPTAPMGQREHFDEGLLVRIRQVLNEGDIVTTLSNGRPNIIGRIDDLGIEVTTERSATQGGPLTVPAWMFNLVWQELNCHGRVERDAVAKTVKRASAVLAILERLPEITVEARRPLVLSLRSQT